MRHNNSYTHPNPVIYRVQQIGTVLLLALMVMVAVLLVVVALLIGAPLFIVMSALILLLAAPVLMTLVNTPPLTVAADGITLNPLIGASRHIAWEAIAEVRPYPLLPGTDQEVVKRWMIGRKHYRPAEGLMLIVPSLPAPYRIAGFLAGAGGVPVIAVTNRTHTDYGQLAMQIARHTET